MNKTKYLETLKEIADSVEKAQESAKTIGINNLSQPGIIKEIITAHKLKHRVNPAKKEHDAEDFENKEIKYEYLSCFEGKSFQFDRVDKKNLKRRVLDRNKAVYCSVFDKNNSLDLLKIYEIEPNPLYKILLRKYENSSATSRHVGVTEKEVLKMIAKKEAKLVFTKK